MSHAWISRRVLVSIVGSLTFILSVPLPAFAGGDSTCIERAAERLKLPKRVSLELADGTHRSGALTEISADGHTLVLRREGRLRADQEVVPMTTIRSMKVGRHQFSHSAAFVGLFVGGIAGASIAGRQPDRDPYGMGVVTQPLRMVSGFLLGGTLGFIGGGVISPLLEKDKTIRCDGDGMAAR